MITGIRFIISQGSSSSIRLGLLWVHVTTLATPGLLISVDMYYWIHSPTQQVSRIVQPPWTTLISEEGASQSSSSSIRFLPQIQRNTTPMYRSPEMIDLYSNHPVNEKADIWVSWQSRSCSLAESRLFLAQYGGHKKAEPCTNLGLPWTLHNVVYVLPPSPGAGLPPLQTVL